MEVRFAEYIKTMVYYGEYMIAGYWVQAIGRTPDEAEKALKKEYYRWLKHIPKEHTWAQWKEYVGLVIKPVEFGKIFD